MMMKFERQKLVDRAPGLLKRKFFIFIVVNISIMLDLFNVTSVLVSIRYLQEHYQTTQALASWTLSAYAVTFAGFIAFAGRTGDIIGHDTQFILGTFIFGIFSLICAVVENIYVFIVFRAFQGMAASTLIPSSYALVAHLYTGRELNMALTIISGVLCVANSGGLIVGGAFLESDIKVKGVPYVSFGISLLLSICALFCFPKIQRNTDKLKDLDYIGSSTLIGGLILIVVGFTEGGENWNDPRAYVILTVGFVLVLIFFIYENYISPRILPNVHLLIPKPVWSIPNFLPLVFNSILNFAGFFGMIYVSTSYFLFIEGNSPLLAGVKYLPFIVTLMIATIIMTIIYGKWSPKWVSTFGFFIGVVGLILSSRINYETDNYYWKYAFTGQVILAGGSVLYFVHYLNLIITVTPLQYQGIVSGIAQTFAQFGVALSFAVITSIVGDTQDKKELNLRYRDSIYFCLACYAVGVLILLFFVHDVKPEQDEPDKPEEQVETCESSEKLDV